MKRSGSISVDVDVTDVLDELSDEDLIAEMSDRNLSVGGPGASFDLLSEIHWHLLHAGVQSALAMLESAMAAKAVSDNARQRQFQAMGKPS